MTITDKRTCSVPVCSRIYYAKEFCRAHYETYKRGGDISKKINGSKDPQPCSIEECKNEARVKGLCITHNVRLVRGQSLSTPVLPRTGRRKDPRYRTMRSTLSAMKRRCNNPNSQFYHRYGGRGITVCERWNGADGIKNFIEDMGFRPSNDHSIDRIDNDRGYFPENCRWATKSEQESNKGIPRHNTSGYKGVMFDKRKKKWIAIIQRNGVAKYLGSFDSPEEASLQYENERLELSF